MLWLMVINFSVCTIFLNKYFPNVTIIIPEYREILGLIKRKIIKFPNHKYIYYIIMEIYKHGNA